MTIYDFKIIIGLIIFMLHLYTILYSTLHFGITKDISNKKDDKNLDFVKEFCILSNFVMSFIYNFYYYYSDKYFVRGQKEYFYTSLFNIFEFFVILMITLFTQDINPILNINILSIWCFYIILNSVNIIITNINFRIKKYNLEHDFRTITPQLLEQAYQNELINIQSDNMTEVCTDPGDDVADVRTLNFV